MRKITVEVEATVMLPVVVTTQLDIRAEDDADINIDKTVNQIAQNKSPKNADLENAKALHAKPVNTGKNYDHEEHQHAVEAAVNDFLNGRTPTFTILNTKITQTH